ncbi:hypothetical protein [Dyella amyloliquefaciens]|uniref:hypothetical protein n=1 Tax=Dyella amyloliquefaciens TaxID=1770545 RepID=UPI0013EE7636|nr:hypothetical protein [Dyella amyloliquefaciens]
MNTTSTDRTGQMMAIPCMSSRMNLRRKYLEALIWDSGTMEKALLSISGCHPAAHCANCRLATQCSQLGPFHPQIACYGSPAFVTAGNGLRETPIDWFVIR